MSATSAFHGSESKFKAAIVLAQDKSNLKAFMPHLGAALEACDAEYLLTPVLNTGVGIVDAMEKDTDSQGAQQVMQIMALALDDQGGADFEQAAAARKVTQPTPTKGSAESEEAYAARADRECRADTLRDLIAKLPAEAIKRFLDKTYFLDWRKGHSVIETAKDRAVRQ